PVYVSNVVYGRMMMFSLTSTASESDIRAMLNVAYNGLGANVKANMSAKQKTMLEQSEIAITSLGGDADATISMIKSGNWKDYFTNTAPLTSAAPLSYTLRNLGDGSIANITETDEFSISECTEKVGVPGVFDFLPATNYSLGDISFPVESFTADFNGDGMEDIMLNHKNGSLNQIKIGYGTMEGGFDFQPIVTNPESPADSWQSYTTQIGDLNGDQQPDIIWNFLSNTNQSYFALGQGGTQFQYSSHFQASVSGWSLYHMDVGDVDADGADEIICNTLTNSANRAYTFQLTQDESSLEQINVQDFGGGGWGDYELFLGNVNGGGEDLLFNELMAYNHTYVAQADGDGSFSLRPYDRHPVPGPGWGNYTAFAANADNNTNTDFILSYPSPNNNFLYINLSNPDGSFQYLPLQTHPVGQDWTDYKPYVGDVDGDGIADVIWTNQASGEVSANVYTALGTNNGTFDFSPVKQTQPYQTTWSQYVVNLMDINGDGKKDILWFKPGTNAEAYVALAK
ncbi:MAG: FG-GAP-like repeat-containing protein, partial [Bacteroidota bacterium]